MYSMACLLLPVILNLCKTFCVFAVLIYACCIIGCMTIVGEAPLFFEYICESAYPIAEGITISFMMALNKVASMLFLLVLLQPNGKWYHLMIVTNTIDFALSHFFSTVQVVCYF